jgi:hypothetical protein
MKVQQSVSNMCVRCDVTVSWRKIFPAPSLNMLSRKICCLYTLNWNIWTPTHGILEHWWVLCCAAFWHMKGFDCRIDSSRVSSSPAVKQTAWLLKMGPVGCPEMLATNYHSTLHKIPKSAHLIYTTAEAWYHEKCVAPFHGDGCSENWMSQNICCVFFLGGVVRGV